MNRLSSTIVAASLASAALTASPANAQVFEIATGIAGGLVDGVLFGGRFVTNPAASPPPNYEAQMPPPSGWIYANAHPICQIRNVRVWNGYGWYHRRIEVCG